jgi:hypothetical protein
LPFYDRFKEQLTDFQKSKIDTIKKMKVAGLFTSTEEHGIAAIRIENEKFFRRSTTESTSIATEWRIKFGLEIIKRLSTNH